MTPKQARIEFLNGVIALARKGLDDLESQHPSGVRPSWVSAFEAPHLEAIQVSEEEIAALATASDVTVRIASLKAKSLADLKVDIEKEVVRQEQAGNLMARVYTKEVTRPFQAVVQFIAGAQ